MKMCADCRRVYADVVDINICKCGGIDFVRINDERDYFI